MKSDHLVETVERYLTTEKRCERAWLTGQGTEASRQELERAEQQLQQELATAKAHHAGTGFARILVGIANNPRAAWVLHTAEALARAVEGAALRIVHVVNVAAAVNNEFGVADEKVLRGMRETGEKFVARMVGEVRGPAEAVVVEGEPGREIVEAARQWKADVIVMAAPSHGQFVELLTGSVVEYVMRHAPCAVMTVGCEKRV